MPVTVFTARHIACFSKSICLSVCLSICLSKTASVSNRQKLLDHGNHQQMALKFTVNYALQVAYS